MRSKLLLRLTVLGSLLAGPACSFIQSFDGLSDTYGQAPSTPDASDGATEGSGPDVVLPDASAADVVVQDATDASSIDAGSYRDEVLKDRPLAYFPLDESPGTLFAASSVGGAPLNIVGAIGFGAAGVVGTSASFPGTEFDYLTAGDRFDFALGAAFSLEVWFKAKTAVATQRLIAFKFEASNGYGLGLYGALVGFTVGGKDASDISIGDLTFSGLLDAGFPTGTPPLDSGLLTEWHHLVGTFDGATIRLILDGVNTMSVPVPALPTNHAEPFVVGGGFDGEIDELAIYNKALSVQRARAHYLAR